MIGPSPPSPSPIARVAAHLLLCLRFYTRLPVPAFAFEDRVGLPASFGPVLAYAPVAGLALGCAGGLVLAAAAWLGLPPLVAATLASAALILASGALHEDGLADVADGFGGGRTRERKLAIMRDSRIGAFGTLAIGLSLLLRIASLAALIERHGATAAVLALLAAAAFSRGIGLLPLACLPPARADGLGAGAGRLPWPVALGGMMPAVLLALALPAVAGLSVARTLPAVAVGFAAVLGVTRLAAVQVGGQTGDVAGAAQQGADIGYLVALLVRPVG